MSGEQVIPPAALADPNSIELGRIWVAQSGVHCSLRIGMYKAQGMNEAFAWGIVAADLMRHVANAIATQEGRAPEEVLYEVTQGLQAELESPTSDTPGNFLS